MTDACFPKRLVISRKNYRCDCCRQIITQGECHIYWPQVCDGNFAAFRMHEDCRDWEEFLNQRAGYWDDEWTPLHEHVSNEGAGVLEGAPDAVRARFKEVMG